VSDAPPEEQDASLDEGDEHQRTPFDNPFFLPVVLLGFALWMGYDGWLNSEFRDAKLGADEQWKIAFNQWGFAVCGLLGVWTLLRALRERAAARRG